MKLVGPFDCNLLLILDEPESMDVGDIDFDDDFDDTSEPVKENKQEQPSKPSIIKSQQQRAEAQIPE